MNQDPSDIGWITAAILFGVAALHGNLAELERSFPSYGITALYVGCEKDGVVEKIPQGRGFTIS